MACNVLLSARHLESIIMKLRGSVIRQYAIRQLGSLGLLPWRPAP